MFKSKKRLQEEMEMKKKAEERAALEKECREKLLFNQTLNSLKKAMQKYEEQKGVFIQFAREAEKRGMKAQYQMAKNGLKIVMDSYDRVWAMYLNLTISNQIKQVTNDTKMFVDSMSSISRQLSEINASIDFTEMQLDYTQAMAQISQAEEKLKGFSENVYSTIEDYASSNSDSKIDSAYDELIHSDLCEESAKEREEGLRIDRKIDRLEEMIHGK